MDVYYVVYPGSKPWCSDFTAINLVKYSKNYVVMKTHKELNNLENSIIHIHNVQIFSRFLRPWRVMDRLYNNGNKVIVGLRGNKGLKKYDEFIRTANGVSVGVDPSLHLYASRLNKNVYVLPPGEDPDKFKPLEVPKEFTVSWVGRDNKPFKNANLLPHLGYSFRKATYSNYIPHDELPLFYNKSHVLVNFSDYEGFWRPGIEGAMCGLPIISTDVGAIRDIIDKEFILPTPAIDYLDLYRAQIKWFLDNPEDAARIGAENRKRALKYSWRKVVPLHDEAWRDIS